MNLRDFLQQRELALANEIDELRAKLVPLEAELAEVRRVKAALGMGVGLSSLRQPGTAEALAAISRAFGKAQTAKMGAFAIELMTMKELVIGVLTNHFPAGATTKQMIGFFRDVWGRTIERTNLSPQISRLHQEGVIGRLEGTKAWYLSTEERRGKRPYRETVHQMQCGELIAAGERVVWLAPADVTRNHTPVWPEGSDAGPEED